MTALKATVNYEEVNDLLYRAATYGSFETIKYIVDYKLYYIFQSLDKLNCFYDLTVSNNGPEVKDFMNEFYPLEYISFSDAISTAEFIKRVNTCQDMETIKAKVMNCENFELKYLFVNNYGCIDGSNLLLYRFTGKKLKELAIRVICMYADTIKVQIVSKYLFDNGLSIDNYKRIRFTDNDDFLKLFRNCIINLSEISNELKILNDINEYFTSVDAFAGRRNLSVLAHYASRNHDCITEIKKAILIYPSLISFADYPIQLRLAHQDGELELYVHPQIRAQLTVLRIIESSRYSIDILYLFVEYI